MPSYTYSHEVARSTDVSIWVSQLRAGTLPTVCVKSGQAATSKLTFEFITPRHSPSGWFLEFFLGEGVGYAAGHRARGPLPLSKRWRATLMGFRAIAIAAGAFGAMALLATGLLPSSWKATGVGVSFGAFATCLVTVYLYAGLLRPKGTVHATPTGELWVHLHEVHPNFVDAVERMAP
jgi:hypothetical protein